ncbi:HlyD family type I secretion periplasmic adaptor subunit [Rosenbergiella epipactidis]|nr:HlyD family type I secretion periplasmic adaptor subunit [Rosenbergiella epipactidis]
MQAALIIQKTPVSLILLYLIAAIIIVTLVWAKFTQVEEVTVGEGTVIPVQREQIIQSLEGGILSQLLVREGDIVDIGTVLAKIDPTRADTSYKEGISKIIGLKGMIARLRAEAFNIPLVFPDDVKAFPEVIHNETQAYLAQKQTLDEGVSSLRKSYNLAQDEINLSEPLMKKGLISEVELLRMRRQANDFTLQITERQNKFRSDANADLNKMETELAQTQAQVEGREDIVKRTTVLSPVHGTINNIKVTTVGGVIPQGGEIMSVIPLEDQLLVEAKIKPADVAFLHPGQPAMVKITAYDYSIYGGLKGKVQNISADTIKDDKPTRQGERDTTYYRVYIRTDKSELRVKNKVFPIIPGMIASVEIRTGEKTILSYLLKPVLKAREAFRER